MKIWLDFIDDTSEYAIWDHKPMYLRDVYGPIEISNELYERVRESDREAATIQDILHTLVYDWKYPEEDCD